VDPFAEQINPSHANAARLVELAEQDLAAVQKLHSQGVVSDGELRNGRVELLKARISLACERKQRDELARLFDELIAEREADHADQQRLHAAGVVTETDVRNAEKRVLQERERKQAALDALE
jgi:outer membrane protein TolC